VVIELGTDWVPHDPGRRSPAKRRRRLLVAAALGCLLLILTLAGSATRVPSWRLVTTVPASINDYWELAGDRLFMSRSPAFTAIDAYDLSQRRRLWRATLPERPYLLLGSDSTGVLLAETAGTGPGHGQLTALDARTGRVRWQLAGASVRDIQSVHNSALLAATRAGGGDELRLVDVRTGAAIWSLALPPGVTSEVLGAGRLVLWSPAGGTRLVEESSGRILASGQPTVALSDSGFVPGSGRYVVGEQLLVADPGERATVMPGR
jgi:outer membrane protein assembly factor BamB